MKLNSDKQKSGSRGSNQRPETTSQDLVRIGSSAGQRHGSTHTPRVQMMKLNLDKQKKAAAEDRTNDPRPRVKTWSRSGQALVRDMVEIRPQVGGCLS
jgi:hypothetical protein